MILHLPDKKLNKLTQSWPRMYFMSSKLNCASDIFLSVSQKQICGEWAYLLATFVANRMIILDMAGQRGKGYGECHKMKHRGGGGWGSKICQSVLFEWLLI